MIYTPHEAINGRGARKGRKPRPAGETPIAMIYQYCVKTGVKRAPIGHETSCFARRRQGVCDARKPCFLEESRSAAKHRTRAARGDINKSAEI
jgi:hypothetical protein